MDGCSDISHSMQMLFECENDAGIFFLSISFVVLFHDDSYLLNPLQLPPINDGYHANGRKIRSDSCPNSFTNQNGDKAGVHAGEPRELTPVQ